MFADEDFSFLVVRRDNVGDGKDVGVVFARRGGEGNLGGEVDRARADDARSKHPVGDSDACGRAAEAGQSVARDRQAERAYAGGGVVFERNFGDDDLDPHLGEEDVDFCNEFVDETDVVDGAGNDDGVAALFRENREEGAELVGLFEREADPGGTDKVRGRGIGGGTLIDDGGRRGGGEARGVGLAGGLGRVVLPGDKLAENRGNIFGGRVLEINDFVARVRIGLHVEAGDEVVEERMLARVGDEHDLVGAVVGIEGGGRAELGLEGAGKNHAHLVYHVAGLGEAQLVKLRREAGQQRLVEAGDEGFDALEVGQRVGDKGRVGFFEQDRRAARARIEQTGDLRHEFIDAEEI